MKKVPVKIGIKKIPIKNSPPRKTITKQYSTDSLPSSDSPRITNQPPQRPAPKQPQIPQRSPPQPKNEEEEQNEPIEEVKNEKESPLKQSQNQIQQAQIENPPKQIDQQEKIITKENYTAKILHDSSDKDTKYLHQEYNFTRPISFKLFTTQHVKSVAMGDNHYLMVTMLENKLYSWGFNSHGN